MLQGSETSSHGFELSILVEISGHNCSGVLAKVPQLCLGLQTYDGPALPEPDILSLALVQAQPEPVQYFFRDNFQLSEKLTDSRPWNQPSSGLTKLRRSRL